MAKNETIDELVSEKAFKQIERLTTDLKAAKSELSEFILLGIKASNSVGSSKTHKELIINTQNVTKALQVIESKQQKIRLQETHLQQVREQSLKKESDAISKREAQAEKAHQRSLARIAKDEQIALKQAARTAEQSRAFNVLAKSLSVAEKEAMDLGVTFGVTSKEFIDATKNVQALRKQVDAIEQPLGKFQRNVGNYAGGFSGLGNSINQLTREFPAFTYSVQTGFMALSNNLPIFFDQIRQTQVEIKALRAQGEKVPGLFSQLTSSVLSWGTALSIGITLFTVYGKEIGGFVSTLFKGKGAMDEFSMKQKALNEGLKSGEYKTAVSNVIELTNVIDLAKKGFISKEGALKQYNETIGKTTGQVGSLDEAEKALQKNAPSYIKMMLLKAAAQAVISSSAEDLADAAKDVIEAEEEQQKEIKKTQKVAQDSAKNVRLYGAAAQAAAKARSKASKEAADSEVKENKTAFDKIVNSIQSVSSKLLAEAATISKEFKFNFFDNADGDETDNSRKEQLELIKANLEAQKTAAQNIYEDEKNSLEKRLNSLEIYEKTSIALIRNSQAIQLTEAGLSETKKRTIAQESANQISQIQRDKNRTEKDIAEVAENELELRLKKGAKDLEDAEQAKILLIQEAGQDRLRLIEQHRSEALNALGEQYAQGLIKEKQYREQSYDIESAAASDRLQVQIDALKEEIKLEEENLKFGIGTNRALGIDVKKLADLEIEASNLTTRIAIENAEKEYQAKKELKEKEKELAYALFEIGEELVAAQFEREEARNTKALEDIDKQEERQKKALETQILTQDEKAIKIAQIEAKAQVDREAIEKRQRSLEISRARFEKAASIARIIALTAENVMKYGAITPLSILVAAIGAAQVAKVLATPIPKFEKGGKMGFTGLAEYGHGTELRIDPDGKYSLTKSTPEVGIVEKGTQFISNANLKRMIAKPDHVQYVGGQQVDIGKLIEAQRNSTNELKKAILSQKEARMLGISYKSSRPGNWKDYERGVKR
ncbi:hypothetical protein WG906_09775 [Pedobacter sp. P351]|uniref:hypothetical protein n=1 Tax=Pedobacter superstes TaxID=3133441 RepID=UPI0030ACEC2C